MLVDDVTITVCGGDGGDGAISFRQNEGNPRGGPDGGNGGNGGDVYLVGTDDLTALSQFQYKKYWKAQDGVDGKRKNLFGKNADDLNIKVPVGTRVFLDNGTIIGEISQPDQTLLVAHGGKGGRGNNEFKSATNQTPRIAEQGEPGEEKLLRLELRLIADVGLIGLPNAGKSTLLSVLTNATPKIGNYPFTTLEPNIGMMGDIMIADIPGLIEGASKGKGLGIKFLKHIEKTKLLVHCIDSTQNVLDAYNTIKREFLAFNSNLLQKEELVILTKSDELDEKTQQEKIKTFQSLGMTVLIISAYDDGDINQIKHVLRKEMQKRMS